VRRRTCTTGCWGPVIFAIEFKVGESAYRRADIPIVPILVATEATWSNTALLVPHADGVYPPCRCNADGLAHLITEGLAHATGRALDATVWDASPYQPTPTIIEAAQALYSQHSVEAIARHDAGARNLRVTPQRVEALIDEARQRGHKIIVFVTGVPGAGKTLVGLNVATRKRDDTQPTHAVFLSGNGTVLLSGNGPVFLSGKSPVFLSGNSPWSPCFGRRSRVMKSRVVAERATPRGAASWGKPCRRSSRTCITFETRG
jgi:hypothetical protein